MAPAAKIPEILLATASFGAAPGTVPAGTAADLQQRRLLGGRIVTNRRIPRNRNDRAVARDSPRSRRHRGNEVGRWPAKRARYGPQVHGPQVHGTCSENPREFIGIRIVWYDTGDSPRGHGGGQATAAVGWAVESSQTEESPGTATAVPLPGTVPAVADTGEMRWAAGRQKEPVTGIRCTALRCITALRCMALAAKIPENLLASASFGAAPGTVPTGAAAGVQQWPLAGRRNRHNPKSPQKPQRPCRCWGQSPQSQTPGK